MPRKLPPPPPGFPWKGKFTEVKQVKEYFNHPKLQCLLCGREYGNLALHITGGHKISHDDYKAQFGIPWSYGLAGMDFKTGASKNLKKLRKLGKIAQSPSKEHIKKLVSSQKKKRPSVEAIRNENRRKILEQHGRTEKWQPEDYEEILQRMLSGRTPMEVCQNKDLPGHSALHKYLKANPKFERKYDKILNNLPYEVLVRANKLGPKFRNDVIRLRRQDMTWPEIAEQLGVTEHVCRTTWHKMKARGKLKISDRKHEYQRYTRQDYDEYLRRISTGRMITDVGLDADMPQPDLFYIYLRKNPDFKKKFQKMWEKLPYKYQAQSRRMGKNFRRDVVKLHKRGHDWNAVGKMLGVKPSLAQDYYNKKN